MIEKNFDETIEGLLGRDDNERLEMCEHVIYMPTMTTPKDIEERIKDKACKVFEEMLIELCPELLGYGAMAVEWENEFRRRLEE